MYVRMYVNTHTHTFYHTQAAMYVCTYVCKHTHTHIPYGLVRRRYTYSEGPPDLGVPEIRHIWYKIVPKTQFKRESFGKSVPPIASFELPVRYAQKETYSEVHKRPTITKETYYISKETHYHKGDPLRDLQ